MIARRFSVPFVIALEILALPAWSQTPQLNMLHDDLHLTAQQEEPWRKFQLATQIDPQEVAKRRNAAELMPTLTAPRRVDLSIAAMEADLQAFERRGAALKIFYAALSPEQQAIFDHETALQQQ